MYEWIKQLDQITMDLPTDMLIIAPPHERSKDPTNYENCQQPNTS